ncbi:hypothetical protein Psi01_81020 [Planobispora siamensis]|uniref:Uncharacterized protein n=1 Tax=Planobispora siamensis TaxID=936338 RepID=A0A8J3WQY5_9ACTN|nr:hypothetical protein Psi01_81020 [Planobispora siamensis]
MVLPTLRLQRGRPRQRPDVVLDDRDEHRRRAAQQVGVESYPPTKIDAIVFSADSDQDKT